MPYARLYLAILRFTDHHLPFNNHLLLHSRNRRHQSRASIVRSLSYKSIASGKAPTNSDLRSFRPLTARHQRGSSRSIPSRRTGPLPWSRHHLRRLLGRAGENCTILKGYSGSPKPEPPRKGRRRIPGRFLHNQTATINRVNIYLHPFVPFVKIPKCPQTPPSETLCVPGPAGSVCTVFRRFVLRHNLGPITTSR